MFRFSSRSSCAIFLLLFLSGSLLAAPRAWIRINQLGYLPHARKVAVLMAEDPVREVREFEVCDLLTGQEVLRLKSIRPFGRPTPRYYQLDFSRLRSEGAYVLRCTGVESPPFRVARDVYDGAADFLLRYMREQRCGFNPFLQDSCHTADGYTVYDPDLGSRHIDVVGGWHDASDYLQYVTTSANAVVQMLFAYQMNGGVFQDSVGANGLAGKNRLPDILDEALWGVAWLRKMNPRDGVFYHQVADDRDHLGFRLPTEDTVSYGRGRERPVYRATGRPQGLLSYRNHSTGVASLAGKFASAFAMTSRLLPECDSTLADTLAQKALEAYRYGRAHEGVCQTAPCRSPYYYQEENWVDDMELAATQLALLFPDSSFLDDALRYGEREPVTPWMGAERAAHYQWYPFVNLGHYFLGVRKNQYGREFRRFLGEGLKRLADRGASDPFGIGVPFIWCSNNLVAAALTQAHLYEKLSGDSTYAGMEAALRDWLFGCNPWGTSMIVGLPQGGISPGDPHSAFTHLKGYPIDGGLVDGPVARSVFESLKGVRLSRDDPFAEFQSERAVYHDDWADYSTNEPTMDGTASLTYILSAYEQMGDSRRTRERRVYDQGGIVRMDTARKEVYLLFSGDEFGSGRDRILRTLARHRVKASFFFTGAFYRNPVFAPFIRALKNSGHYLGAHSDRHLLYVPWENRDSLLVTEGEFLGDLRANYQAMEVFGIRRMEAPYFLPPFEWYNASVSTWCSQQGLSLVNFTPGTWTNADYTFPGGGGRYLSTEEIIARLLEKEKSDPAGLNGALLLLHCGVDPRRPDPLFEQLDRLLKALEGRGYRFRRLGG